ncbi:hypothetical protein BLOT_004315 [Blomia tropicalis]|nr:hypothetical protein BLOT_004315 [Blomia tropicalis]
MNNYPYFSSAVHSSDDDKSKLTRPQSISFPPSNESNWSTKVVLNPLYSFYETSFHLQACLQLIPSFQAPMLPRNKKYCNNQFWPPIVITII